MDYDELNPPTPPTEEEDFDPKDLEVQDETDGLPVLIRYRLQDYETRYVRDGRPEYIRAYNKKNGAKGFVAMIPPTEEKRTARRRAVTIGLCVLAVAAMATLTFCILRHVM